MATSFTDRDGAREHIASLGDDFFIVRNPSYVYPEYEVVPLAPKAATVPALHAVVMDMDGTTTTTEEICLHSLEYMVRCISGRLTQDDWIGLDQKDDYPHVIGNSTTRHVEFLLNRYGNWIDPMRFAEAAVRTSAWTLRNSRDDVRMQEVRGDLANLGIPGLMDSLDDPDDSLVERYAESLIEPLNRFDARLRLAITIYYQRYHYILSLISAGDETALRRELPFLDEDTPLISPMPGIGEFLALARGLLPDDDEMSAWLIDQLRQHPRTTYSQGQEQAYRRNYAFLVDAFRQRPLKIAVVTSSIRYEAEVVLGEVFRVLREQAESWPLETEDKDRVLDAFDDWRSFYDTVVTASDSSEMRLKPHRDLYSLALHQVGVDPDDFDKVIGFEDSESGTVAIRAAGVNLCIAVPFFGTEFHNLEAACHTIPACLPQAILEHTLFIGNDVAPER
jgi:beta-phosphoglucomutase-like phosphatase (HAD superfamily)